MNRAGILQRDHVAPPAAEEPAKEKSRRERGHEEDKSGVQLPAFEGVHRFGWLDRAQCHARDEPLDDVRGHEHIDKGQNDRSPLAHARLAHLRCTRGPLRPGAAGQHLKRQGASAPGSGGATLSTPARIVSGRSHATQRYEAFAPAPASGIDGQGMSPRGGPARQSPDRVEAGRAGGRRPDESPTLRPCVMARRAVGCDGDRCFDQLITRAQFGWRAHDMRSTSASRMQDTHTHVREQFMPGRVKQR